MEGRKLEKDPLYDRQIHRRARQRAIELVLHAQSDSVTARGAVTRAISELGMSQGNVVRLDPETVDLPDLAATCLGVTPLDVVLVEKYVRVAGCADHSLIAAGQRTVRGALPEA